LQSCEPGEWRRLLEEAGMEDREALERARLCFVEEHFSLDVAEASQWIRELRTLMGLVVDRLSAKGVLLPKEMRSFIEDPLRHLVKKLFIYAHDVVRRRISVEEFERVAAAAARTSLRTNMRSVYEAWVLLALLSLLTERGRAEIVYPEHRFILIERTGRQRGGRIPPNIVLRLGGRGLLSFYLEAPRPISWGDSSDLARAWKLYIALRPDMMIYSGLVENMVDLESDPPIRRPDFIVEVKELGDWYTRAREVRGPFAKRMTAEEWRNRWLRGLWAGLADVLGVSSPESAYEEAAKRKRGLRLTEPQIVKLYARIYKPRRLYLVSRMPVPENVAAELEGYGVTVVDGVGFSVEALEPLARELASAASFRGAQRAPLYIDAGLLARLEQVASQRGLRVEELAEALLKALVSDQSLVEKLLGRVEREGGSSVG